MQDFSDKKLKTCLERLELIANWYTGEKLFNEESSEYAKLYHPYSYEDLKFAPALPLMTFSSRSGQVPDKVIVDEERFGKVL